MQSPTLTTSPGRLRQPALLSCRVGSRRLKTLVLRWLPVTKNKAMGGEAAPAGESPIKAVLRSKGFMWMSNSHGTAYYWSHAGMHFEIRDEGDWCALAMPCVLCRRSSADQPARFEWDCRFGVQ